MKPVLSLFSLPSLVGVVGAPLRSSPQGRASTPLQLIVHSCPFSGEMPLFEQIAFLGDYVPPTPGDG